MIIDTPNGPKEISDQEVMKIAVRSAWQEFEEIAKVFEEGEYRDEDLPLNKARAEGYAEELGMAYYMFYKEEYDSDSKEK